MGIFNGLFFENVYSEQCGTMLNNDHDDDAVDMFDFNQFRELLGASSGKAYKSPSVFFSIVPLICACRIEF